MTILSVISLFLLQFQLRRGSTHLFITAYPQSFYQSCYCYYQYRQWRWVIYHSDNLPMGRRLVIDNLVRHFIIFIAILALSWLNSPFHYCLPSIILLIMLLLLSVQAMETGNLPFGQAADGEEVSY